MMTKNFVTAVLGILIAGQAISQSQKVPDASIIIARKQVPILCYHQVRDWKPTDSKMAKDYIMPPANLRAQLQMLADSGYHTILPRSEEHTSELQSHSDL